MKYVEIAVQLDEIQLAAREFLQLTKDVPVWIFSGDLGAGKTTFIASLCRELGVQDIVSSPTYAIVQQYTSGNGKNIYHMDLYRIRDEEEAIQSGLEDCLLSGDLCMVEWPENAEGIIPQHSVHTAIRITGEQQRKLLIQLPE